MYLKTKIAEAQNIPNGESNSCTSDPNELAKIMQLKSKLSKQPFHHRGIDSISAHRSVANESKASVYYTPNDSIDQSHQLQSSPMHINYIQENLNTFADCLKPEPRCKFDFNMHRLEENLKREIDQRRRRHTILCAKLGGGDDADDDDETIDINSEQTRMLNQSCSKNGDCGDGDDVVNNLAQGYIPLNTLPSKHNSKFKRSASGKDMYYSLDNVFDVVSSGVVSQLYEMAMSNKTIDEASETQVTSSTSENSSSSNNMSRSHAMTRESLEDNNPSRSMLMLNGAAHLNDVPTSSNSMPNIISKMESFSIECHDDAAAHNDDHTDAKTTAISATANDCC